jgi:hypothetical protein
MSEQQQQEVNITTEDLVMVVRLVDTCAARGALTGDDLEAVGGLRRRVLDFLKVNAPQLFEKPEVEADPEATTEA